MTKNAFTEKQILQFQKLDIVEKITQKQIYFTRKFKVFALQEREKGLISRQIFANAGVDISLFKGKYFKNLLLKWSHEYQKNGEQAFITKPKGPQKKSRKAKKLEEMSPEEIKARMAYLEAEVTFLKKLKGFE